MFNKTINELSVMLTDPSLKKEDKNYIFAEIDKLEAGADIYSNIKESQN